jgi:hypothetical protein
LALLSPNACLPARSAHAAALMGVLLPLAMWLFPSLLKNGLRTVLCWKSAYEIDTATLWPSYCCSIAERVNCHSVIKVSPFSTGQIAYFQLDTHTHNSVARTGLAFPLAIQGAVIDLYDSAGKTLQVKAVVCVFPHADALAAASASVYNRTDGRPGRTP